MCWYYFGVVHGDEVARDHKGTGLADMEAARAHALGIWRRIIEEEVAVGRDPQHLNVVIVLGFRSALRVPARPHAYSDEAGRGFRFEAGRHSEAKPATGPI
jgi:hypothetical protein